MEKELIDHEFNNIIDLMIQKTLLTLDHLKPRLLDSDSNKGLTELSLQLLLFNNIINQCNPLFEIEIEKSIEGERRCDIFIKNKRNDVLIIEIKYIKIPFLENTIKDYVPTLKFYEKFALWGRINNEIKNMKKNEIDNLKRRTEFIKSTDGTKQIDKYQTIQSIMLNAEKQAEEYSKTFKSSDWRKINVYNMYYIVITGIGFNLIKSPLLKLNK
jgi:hypothetical protein